MKIEESLLLFESPLGNAEIEINHPIGNLLIGDIVSPYGGWLIPVQYEDQVQEPEECMFIWTVTKRKWTPNPYNDEKSYLEITFTGTYSK